MALKHLVEIMDQIPDHELVLLLNDAQGSLNALAPYNGSAPGAIAIGKARDRRDAIQAEIDRRAES